MKCKMDDKAELSHQIIKMKDIEIQIKCLVEGCMNRVSEKTKRLEMQ